ncbi:glycoside hydrolase family 3 protein [Candidatus Epulonipiscium viviparus]|uniref:glycoside hydrolase family 3 protein n=1 Tax=Candidatus Epulonipiscium viviparus TaxID=420336 RepID=UPI0027380411|nr:glycoside hydrolase family 3 protein [Candidatus Epulopiscium viviparus]
MKSKASKFTKFARKVAAEGAVLLKNNSNFLPLAKDEKVAVFGRCQADYYRSGTGSGGAVNVEYKTDLINSLAARNFVTIDTHIKHLYDTWLAQNPFDDGGGGWACEPWCQIEMPLEASAVEAAANQNDKAIVVIGRTAGEDKDNMAAEGSYFLTAAEIEMLNVVKTNFAKVGVIVNVGNIIDMSWVDDKIDMVIYSWHGGMEGGNAIVDVLVGDLTPSGKLPDSIATTIDDYPSTKNHGSATQNFYEEDIYVGYRYLETFAADRVLYPFGFGLSYTQFTISNVTGTIHAGTAKITATVTNVGDAYAGREVVQVYLQAPQGQLGKPTRSLVGFAKTPLLAPHESTVVKISIPFYSMASYDDSGATGHKSAYVLEAGEYIFHVGNSVRETVIAVFDTSLVLDSTKIVAQLEEALAPTTSFNRIRPDASGNVAYEAAPTRTVDLAARMTAMAPQAIAITGDAGINLKNVITESDMEKFIAQLTADDLAAIVRGEGMSHPQVTPGTASAFGGVTTHLRDDLGIPLMCAADGPSGIRMESGRTATQLPIGTLIASTWDEALVEELYTMEGEELKNNYVDVLLGPGLNIHRSPLNGRNFEYFSEDPLLTGKMAAAVVRGVHQGGAEGTLKHFACNSQETHRHEVNAVVSERAVREIYLKGFEIAIKEGNAKSVMTAYNPLNGIWTASNYDLNTTILRGEWGFDGIVMTDWWAKMNDCIDGGEGTRQNVSSMVRAQNDLYMVVGNFGAGSNISQDNIPEDLASGKLSIAQLQRSAKNICKFAQATVAITRDELIFGKPQPLVAQDISTEGLEIVTTELSFTGKTHTFAFANEGSYQLDATFNCSMPGLSQTSCNVYINGNLVTTIQSGNTSGESVTRQLANLDLHPGAYTITCEGVNPTFVIDKFTFTKL